MATLTLSAAFNLLDPPTYRINRSERSGVNELFFFNDGMGYGFNYPANRVVEAIVVTKGFNAQLVLDDEGEGFYAPKQIVTDAGNGKLLKWVAAGLTGDDLIYGSSGNDGLGGYDGDDDIDAGGGHDVVTAGRGDDTIFAGYGNDTIAGENGEDFVWAGRGHDVINGGAGYDTVGIGGPFGVKIDLMGKGVQKLSGTASVTLARVENLIGTEGKDTLVGDEKKNYLDGGRGSDLLSGREGNDILVGRGGDDRLVGGEGRDTFLFEGPGWGRDTVRDFEDGVDKISFGDYNRIDFDDLKIRAFGNDLEIRGQYGYIVLEDTDQSDITKSDFIF